MTHTLTHTHTRYIIWRICFCVSGIYRRDIVTLWTTVSAAGSEGYLLVMGYLPRWWTDRETAFDSFADTRASGRNLELFWWWMIIPRQGRLLY